MSTSPLITFKAGRCTPTPSNPKKLTSEPTPGYLYIYIGAEDELAHFCWRPRARPSTQPEEDLVMIPGDASFTPLLKKGASDTRSPTNGRIFVLKFSSSGEKRYFWLQSKSQHSSGAADWFSARDKRLGEIVNAALSGEEVDAEDVRAEIRGMSGEGNAEAEADAMDLDLERQETGGAGADATGGDVRDEGEESREGGADGGRALPQSTSTVVQNFLNSLQSSSSQQAGGAEQPYTTLPDLLTPTTTIPYIASLPTHQLDALCALLPADLFLLAQESATTDAPSAPTPEAAEAAISALAPEQKREILTRVMRSPQLQQSLGSLTVALRDGGLPMIGEALGVRLRGGGARGRGMMMPLGGGEAVEAFVKGVRESIEEEKEEGTGEGAEEGK